MEQRPKDPEQLRQKVSEGYAQIARKADTTGGGCSAPSCCGDGRVSAGGLALEHPLPEDVAGGLAAYVGCVAGAELRDDYLQTIQDAGFDEVTIEGEARAENALGGDSLAQMAQRFGVSEQAARTAIRAVTSLQIRAVKTVD